MVVATAMNTELGRIAGLMEEAGAEEKTPLAAEARLCSARILVWATLGIVALLFGLGLLRGTKPFELFMTSVSLAVAAVPEGLRAVVTVALALGVCACRAAARWCANCLRSRRSAQQRHLTTRPAL